MSEWLKLSKNVYRKELLPVGKYRKDSDDLDFEISLDTLNHINTTIKGMLDAGVRIPLVKNHDGDSSFGQILKGAIDGESLFVDIEFTDTKCRDEALRNDVSAFIPPEFVDGRGNAWKRPLRHVAITPYPVIPGLGNWETVAASFHTSNSRNIDMLDELISALGLSFSADVTEDNKKKQTVTVVKKLVDQSLQLADELIYARAEKETLRPAKTELPPIIINQVRKSRQRDIEDLLLGEKITPAVAKDLIKEYCDKDSVELALSEESVDEFDTMIRILGKNRAVKRSGRVLKLAHNEQTGDSPLVEAAKARAAMV